MKPPAALLVGGVGSQSVPTLSAAEYTFGELPEAFSCLRRLAYVVFEALPSRLHNLSGYASVGHRHDEPLFPGARCIVVADLKLAGRLVPDLAARGLARVPRPQSVDGSFVQARRDPRLHEHRHLLVGVRGIKLASDDVPDSRMVPATNTGRCRDAIPLQRASHRTDGCAFGHVTEYPPHHLHLRLRHLQGVPVGASAVAISRTLPLDHKPTTALFQESVLSAPGDLFPLPLGELVLHRVAEAVASVVQGYELHPELPEILVPQKPVEPGPEQPVALLGKHDIYGPTLRQLHHSPQAGPVRIRAAVTVVHGLLDHSIALTSGVHPEFP